MGTILRRAAGIGLVAGLANLHVSLVGMVDSFQSRDVIAGVITLGTALPLLIALLAGWIAAAPRTGGPPELNRRSTLLAGAVAGGVGGGVLALLLVLTTQFNVRAVLVNASPALTDALHFGLDFGPGTLLLIIATAAAGLAGAALRVLPRSIARPIAVGFMVSLLVSLLQPFAGAILRNLSLDAVDQFLFSSGGLTAPGFIIVFALAVGITYLTDSRGAATRSRLAVLSPGRARVAKIALFVVIAILLLLLPQLVGKRLSEVLSTVGLYVLLGLGLNIVVGFAGLLDLGYVAFYAVGAYTTGILTSPASPLFAPQISFWAALPFVIIAAALIGLMVGAPVLRLRGDYLAIVTLGFGEIARIIFLSEWLKPVTGGAQGILSIPPPLPFTRDPQIIYYPILLFCVLAALGAVSLANSRVGRAWNAMREDESVAEATGVSTVKYKLLAFGLGAAFGCVSGALFAAKIGTIFPNSFDILVSINALALIILGGMGNIFGVVVGALVLVGLPELLREFADFRLLIYGAVLVAMMILRPEGLLPSRSRRAELHETVDEQDLYESEAGMDTGEPMVTP